MKLTPDYPWGIRDTRTGAIVARSSEGYKAIERAKRMNAKNMWEHDGDERFEVTMEG